LQSKERSKHNSPFSLLLTCIPSLSAGLLCAPKGEGREKSTTPLFRAKQAPKGIGNGFFLRNKQGVAKHERSRAELQSTNREEGTGKARKSRLHSTPLHSTPLDERKKKKKRKSFLTFYKLIKKENDSCKTW
jgi:hypothetical protein